MSVEDRELSRRRRIKNTRQNITPDHRPRTYRITDSVTGWVTDQPRVLGKGGDLPLVDDVLAGTVSVVGSVEGLSMESDGNMRSSRSNSNSSPERRAAPRRVVKEFNFRRAAKALLNAVSDDVWVVRKAS